MRHSTATIVVLGIWALLFPAMRDSGSLVTWTIGLVVLFGVGRLVDRGLKR